VKRKHSNLFRENQRIASHSKHLNICKMLFLGKKKQCSKSKNLMSPPINPTFNIIMEHRIRAQGVAGLNYLAKRYLNTTAGSTQEGWKEGERKEMEKESK
jgi:hypothetical protein